MEVLRPEGIVADGTYHAGWAIAVADGRIVGLGPADGQHESAVTLPGRVLMAGLVDAHSHAFQRAIRGHVQDLSGGSEDFWTWRRAMYQAANGLSPEGVQAVSRLCFLELAEAGVTHVGEFHYLHHDRRGAPYADPDELAHRVIQAALDVGVRITLLRVLYGRGGPNTPLGRDQRRFRDASPEDALAAVTRLSRHPDARVSVGLAPHSVRAVPLSWLSELSTWGGVIHAHVAEQPGEVSGSVHEHGVSPLQVFARAGLVSDRFTAVHLTLPSDGDLALLERAGGTVCVCPSTELDLGDGVFPGHRWGGHVAVGSDSHVSGDLLQEARLVEGLARASAGRRSVGQGRPAARILAAVGAGGSRSLGVDGGLRVGAPADLVAVDVTAPRFAGVPLLEALAFVACAADVTDTWVGGDRVVASGRHPQRDAIVRAAMPFLRRP